MKRHLAVTIVGLVVLISLVSLQGCTFGKRTVGEYFLDRATDAARILEFGITYSKTPQFALYADGVSLGGGGYGNVDGYFIGLGGGQIGITRFYEKSIGLFVWGQETVGWKDYDVNDPATLNTQNIGIGGLIAGPRGIPAAFRKDAEATGPDYMPACAHYIHLGYIGFVGNIRYFQMIDFLAGWFFLDPCGNDGHILGHYPWQDADFRGTPAPAPEETPAPAEAPPTSS